MLLYQTLLWLLFPVFGCKLCGTLSLSKCCYFSIAASHKLHTISVWNNFIILVEFHHSHCLFADTRHDDNRAFLYSSLKYPVCSHCELFADFICLFLWNFLSRLFKWNAASFIKKWFIVRKDSDRFNHFHWVALIKICSLIDNDSNGGFPQHFSVNWA